MDLSADPRAGYHRRIFLRAPNSSWKPPPPAPAMFCMGNARWADWAPGGAWECSGTRGECCSADVPLFRGLAFVRSFHGAGL